MPSILVIDDDANHRRVIRHMLEKMHPGARVSERSEAVAAEHDYVSDIQSYDLVIMDNAVGGQDALGWMKAVMSQYDDAPAFIVLSSVTDPNPMIMQQMAIAIRQGVINFYFKKRLEMKNLLRDIAGVIGEGGGAQQAAPEPEESHDADETFASAQEKAQAKAAAEASLALDMVQGHKHWPFAMDAILAGNAAMGKYQIKAFLGEDSTASTFEAVDTDSGETVALKLINRVKTEGKNIPETFVKNFQALAELDHPYIIKLLGYEAVEDRMVVAMEYLQGGRLDERLERSRLDETMAAHFFKQLLEGMAELHQLGFELHQLVPRQLMLRDPETLVIIQTGLINDLHALSAITGDWPLPFNTPVYSTPENVQKKPTDSRSDIYLAGIIGYEMLAGKPPFSGGSDQDIMYAHAAEPVPPIEGIKQPMNRLLTEMLAKMPEQRPQSAKAALAELNKIYPDV